MTVDVGNLNCTSSESSLPPNKSSGDIGELKPCPFCGGNTYQFFTEHDRAKWGRVMCGCGACGPEVRTNYCADETWHAHAIKEWNTRTPDPESAAEIERLRREKEVANDFLKSQADAIEALTDRALTAESAVAALRFIANNDGNFDQAVCKRALELIESASAIRAAGAKKTAESGHSPSTHNSESE